MRVLLFGATGLTGSFVLEELLKSGHDVTAVSRDAASIKSSHASLQKISGDVLSEEFVRSILPGHDAVVSTISEGPQIRQHTQSQGNGNIIRAMEAAGISRFICMGAEGILDAPGGGLIRDNGTYPELYLPLSYEHSRVQELLQASQLSWTQVCPPTILPQPADGKFVVAVNIPAAGNGKVNAGNIGAFIATELTANGFIKTRVSVANVD